jgi:non-heme chloroperoxidase
MSLQASLKATLASAQALSSTDFRPDMIAFKVPTLLIHGTADKVVPLDTSSRLAALGIAQSNLKIYEGAPHGLFATHKNELTQDLLNFVTE